MKFRKRAGGCECPEGPAGEAYARDDGICSMLCGAARLRGRFQDGGATGEDTARSFEVCGTGSGSGGGFGVGREAERGALCQPGTWSKEGGAERTNGRGRKEAGGGARG